MLPTWLSLLLNIMNTLLEQYCISLTSDFHKIPASRKELLDKIAHYIIAKRTNSEPVNLLYVCTHNSRRSHFGQLWAYVAASYYQVKGVTAYSGGTEVTAFNVHAIQAVERAGFDVNPINTETNTTYHLTIDEKEAPVVCFSKLFGDPFNPQSNFAAIMTCSDAEQNCPFIPGAELRIGTPYDDPKEFDHTPQQDAQYDERCRQIALETFYVFSKVSEYVC